MATRVAKGTAQAKDPGTTWTPISSVVLTTGSTLVVCIANTERDAASAITWNGLSLTKEVVDEVEPDANIAIYAIYNVTGATGDIVVTFVQDPDGCTCIATEIQGLIAAPKDQVANNSDGSGTAHGSGDTPNTTQADEFLIGFTCENDQVGGHGTLDGASDCDTIGQHVETTGGGAPATQQQCQEAYGTQTATGPRQVLTTGSVNDGWAGAILTLKESVDPVIIAGVGTFTHAGSAANLEYGRALDVAVGAFVHAGSAVTLVKNVPIIAGSGSFIHTGSTASLKKGYRLDADSGSFVHAGSVANLEKGYALDVASGLFVHTGSVAILRIGKSLSVDAGVFNHVGSDVALPITYVIKVESGSFVHAGSAANLEKGYRLDAGSGSFSFSGSIALLEIGYAIDALTGIFIHAGSTVNLLHKHILDAGSGSFVLAGSAVVLKKGKEIDAGSGAFTHTGSDVTLTVTAADIVMPADTGVFILNGSDVADVEIIVYRLDIIINVRF